MGWKDLSEAPLSREKFISLGLHHANDPLLSQGTGQETRGPITMAHHSRDSLGRMCTRQRVRQEKIHSNGIIKIKGK